jgi:hypothetical protein
MAKKSNGFNLSETIREYRKSHRGTSARDAMEAIKKSHPDQKINEGHGRGGDASNEVMRAGLTFIRLAGSVDAARERLAGLKDLIETARTVE